MSTDFRDAEIRSLKRANRLLIVLVYICAIATLVEFLCLKFAVGF